ncbi:MAG: CCA tRNA nucleotidyltransferase [Negativicutes bacterium]|jgi:tRNA nucleotidyltransferase/poly(A) polymerase
MDRAQRIILALEVNGYRAVIVGGAVRDIVLGVEPKDIDIATDALPEDVIRIAENCGWKTIEIGAQFGVIKLIIDHVHYEVATFRDERYKDDSHRPEEVFFPVPIKEDLSRRDFTINAMAMDGAGKIADYFGGQVDLQNKVIRTVGSASARFDEDALRMFRAARFAAQLDFTVDSGTLAGIRLNHDRVSGLSVERVRDEIEKTLLGARPSKGLRIMAEYGLLEQFCRINEDGIEHTVPILPELTATLQIVQNLRFHKYDVFEHIVRTVDRTPKDIIVRWAALLHDIAKGSAGVRGINKLGEICDHGHAERGAEIAQAVLARLRVSHENMKTIVWLVKHHMHLPEPQFEAALHWVERLSKSFRDIYELQYGLFQLFSLAHADGLASGFIIEYDATLGKLEANVKKIVSEIPFYVQQLAVDGNVIAKFIGVGPQIGKFQQETLRRIQLGKIKNSRADILDALRAKRAREICKEDFSLQ